jgi:PKD repeat protein
MKSVRLIIAMILLSVCIDSIAQKDILTGEARYSTGNTSVRSTREQIQSHLPGSYHPGHVTLQDDKSSSKIITSNKFFTGPFPDRSNSTRKALSSDITVYNYKEKLDSMIYYDWNLDSVSWELAGIERYIYDIYGRTVDYETETWNVESGHQRIKQTFRYDPDGNVISMMSLTWNDNFADWIPDYRNDYMYDPNGFLKEMYYYTYAYDPPYMEWIINSRTEYSYDERNNPTLILDYYWDNINYIWTESYKTEVFFDENNYDTLSLFSYYTDGVWLNSSRQIINYDLQGNEILYEGYYWNGTGWDPSSKETYLYNADNRTIQYIYYSGWNYDLNQWIPSQREDYTYDLKGNVIQIDYFYYITDTWYQDYKDMHTYDLSANEIDIAMPSWWYSEVGAKFDNASKVTKAYEFLWNGEMSVFDTTEITTLYYSDFLSAPVETLCKAEFKWSVDSINPYIIHFQNLSAADAISWYWDFGDGTTSTLSNPSHVYKSDGIYTATLSVIDQTAFCNSSISSRIVIGIPGCNAFFMPIIDTLTRTVIFQNESAGAVMNYLWNFGDGTVSILKDPPIHQYMKFGVYDVSLTIRNDAGTCMDEFVFRLSLTPPQCKSDFTVFVDSTYNVAYFKSKTQDPANKYYWIFGDGSTSTLSNPVHRFSQPGYFSAMLTVSNEKLGCIDSRKEIILIGSAGIDCKADFIYNVGEENNVFFSDKSSVPAKNYFWNFGDGQFSIEMNPSHKYPQPGYYNVCLTIYAENTIQNITCKKILVAEDEIAPCLAQFYYLVNDSDLIVSLTDESFGIPDSWQWKFNDGWTSNLKNPVYITSRPDYYIAHLNIKNSVGCEDNAFGLINVGKENVLKAGFSFIKRSGGLKADSYPVDLIGVSCGEGSKLKWDFGDGTCDSTTTTPTHVYTAPGTYNVCYTVTDQVTGESDTYCQLVFVGTSGISPGPVENEFQLTSYPNPFSKACIITFNVYDKGPIELSLYDLSGRKLDDIDKSVKEPGSYEIEFDGSWLDSGVYYLLLRSRTGYAASPINVIK